MREDHDRPSLVRGIGFEESCILSYWNGDIVEVVGEVSILIRSSAGHWKAHTHEMKSASMDPAPKNFVYAETYPRCGEGIQLIALPFELGSQG